MIPEYPQFKKLKIEEQTILYRYLSQTQRNICELALANFYLWRDFDHSQLTLINQNLCILISPPNELPYFLEPLGKNKILESVDICLKHSQRISRASENFINQLPKDRFTITPQRSQFDYLYLTKDLVELKGKKYDGKRNHLKKFQKNFPDYQFVPLEVSFQKEALELFEKCFFPQLAYTAQKEAIINAFFHFKELNLLGGVIGVKKTLAGFTLGSYLNKDTICVHFLYGNPDLPGISQTLLWEACQKTFSSSTYLNLEQDLGIPGLRQAKISYHPLRLEKKFEIRPLS